MPRPHILVALVEVVHCGEIIIFHSNLVDSNGMSHLYRGIGIECRRTGEHAPEHGNVCSRMLFGQQVQVVLGRAAVVCDHFLHESVNSLSLFGTEMNELLNFQILHWFIV